MTDKDKLIMQLIEEVREHISMRISKYIDKHVDGSKAELINSFLVFPETNDLDDSLVRLALKAKHTFEAHVTSEVIEVTLNSIDLDDDFTLGFVLTVLPVFLGDETDYYSSPIYIKGSVLQFPGEGLFELFEGQSITELNKFIKEVRNATLIDAIKGNA